MNGRSWHQGCPVPLDDLVSIRLDYIGFDDAAHDGVLVAHRRLANEIVEIFGELFAAGFQNRTHAAVRRFRVGKYAASNDTVGFYCRPAQDDPKVFSSHAYGISIDINPMTNSYHDPKGWWPAGSNGERNRSASGLLTADFEAVKIFMRRGWIWGACSTRPTTCILARSPSATKRILCSDLSGRVSCSLRPTDCKISGERNAAWATL